MNKLIARGNALASRRVRRIILETAASLRRETPDIAVSEGKNGLVLTGRGIGRRWLEEPSLRFAARMSR